MGLQLILVRHGETEMNRKGAYCGWSDSPLTEKGLGHAQRVARKLENESLHIIFSSDLPRTMKTADIIKEFHDIEHVTVKELREINFGMWEGLDYQEIIGQYPRESKYWQADWTGYTVPQGESLQQMYRRVTAAVDEVINRFQDKNILLVTHGGCIRAILAHLIGGGLEDYWKYKVTHGCITRIEIVDGFSILTALNA